MNWRKSSVLKKAVAFAQRPARLVARVGASPEVFRDNPPILVNSFPKSGTHLLLQIAAALPGVRTFGSFLASQPSLTFRERSLRATLRAIRRIAPGEVLGAHLFWDDQVRAELEEKPTVHFFIYRDPRDVVISEAHYLAEMNRWHRLHRYFSRLNSVEERIEFSITGAQEPDFPYDYPDVARRFDRYAEWLEDPMVKCVRFEDLVGEGRQDTIRSLLSFAQETHALDFDLDEMVQRADAAINPGKSATFRSGNAGGWEGTMSADLKRLFDDVAGDLLIRLGYEGDHAWAGGRP